MVCETKTIKIKDDKIIYLKQHLSCKNYGIYAARCLLCSNFYVGQTITSFSQRWNTHRYNWNLKITQNTSKKKTIFENETDNTKDDKAALYIHYAKFHKEKISQEENKIKLSEAYQVIFVEQSRKEKLDITENFWITKLNAQINIAKTYLPLYK